MLPSSDCCPAAPSSNCWLRVWFTFTTNPALDLEAATSNTTVPVMTWLRSWDLKWYLVKGRKTRLIMSWNHNDWNWSLYNLIFYVLVIQIMKLMLWIFEFWSQFLSEKCNFLSQFKPWNSHPRPGIVMTTYPMPQTILVNTANFQCIRRAVYSSTSFACWNCDKRVRTWIFKFPQSKPWGFSDNLINYFEYDVFKLYLG